MAQETYSGYSASFVYTGPTTLSLPQLSGVELSTGKSLAEVVAGGDVDRKAVILSHADPRATLRSADLTAILAVVSPSIGLAVTGAATMQLQLRASGGTFSGGSGYVAATGSGGFLCMTGISARQDDPNGAVCELMYWPNSTDGLAVPLAISALQAAVSPVPAFGSQFFLGKAYLGASELEGLLSADVQFGIDYRYIRSSGDVFARRGAIFRRRPIIRLTFDKVTNVASSAVFSAAIGSTIAVYFWKGAAGGTRVALATTEHAKISITAGEWGTDSISWSEDESGNIVLTIMPTTAISSSVTSAIP